MSRVGKNPITIPEDVKVSLSSGVLSVSSKSNTKDIRVPDCLLVGISNDTINISLKTDTKEARMLWGTTQRNISNVIAGYKKPFVISLTLNGVGYRAQMQGNKLKLALGYSHDIDHEIPKDIVVKCEKPTLIVISGADKKEVGQVAAKISGYRKKDPYKGKGIYTVGENIYRKEGKKK